MSRYKFVRNDPKTQKPGIEFATYASRGERIASFTNDFTIWEAQYIPGKGVVEIWHDEDAATTEEFNNSCASIEEYVTRLINPDE